MVSRTIFSSSLSNLSSTCNTTIHQPLSPHQIPTPSPFLPPPSQTLAATRIHLVPTPPINTATFRIHGAADCTTAAA
ncbi:hypothetical protein [Sporisorium scitamineum]|uniref:Uncharacterized protein n=1 Tax=Sporisorium scitamineum TaxID=49012 RepID=A0A0F7S5G0_9BASI|nr:hypothetical protein [Sporisorium scitamineum]